MASGACPAEFCAFAHELADASGAIIRSHFRSPFAVDTKADQSPVTVADRGAELAIRDLIGRRFPDHGIIGEEFPAVRSDAEHVWVLDPVDGTRAFVAGKPLFATLIALVSRNRPILGVIDQPVLGERWLGAVGRGTTMNGAAVRTRRVSSLDQALLSATSPEMFEGADAVAFERLKRAVRQNHWGGDAYGYALLASGQIDLVVESRLKFYDYAALVPVIEEAGGAIRDWAGQPLSAASDGHVLAVGDAGLLVPASGILTQ
ncbi:MAG: histidinol-phosphatase [Alphaproteobacteria bacterium]|nr:histidinol-phosphatase [Alphaproteobacteria bacterium]